MNAQELVKLAMAATDTTSARQLAEVVGVSHVAIGKWLRGDNLPTFEQAAELAELAGLPPIATAAQIRERADGGRHRKLLKKWVNAAALVLACTIITPSNSHAAQAEISAHKPLGVYIMSNSSCGKLVRSLRH